jgi:hypothetical protein
MSTTGDATDDGRDLPTTDAFAVGDTVRDREDDDPDPATVVNLPPVSCADWKVGSRTVAEDNPEYDSDAEVVVVAFDEDLETYAPDWDGEEPLSLAETDVYVFAFPPGRLAPVEEATETGETDEAGDADETDETGTAPEEASETDEEPPRDPLDGFDGLRELKDRLAERSDVRVETDDGEPVLVVDKLGADHRIHADGSVSDGPIAARLRDVAAEYLGGDAE